MEGFQRNVYLLTKEETKTMTLSDLAKLRGGQRYQRSVTFFRNMTGDEVRNLLEDKFSSVLSNKRFSCASREGQTSAQFNFDGEHRVWDGLTIKRRCKGQSALYLVQEDENQPVFNTVSPARGTPPSLKSHLLSTIFFDNFENDQTASWTQTPQSAATVTSLNITYPKENAVKTTQWERDMNRNNPGWLGDNLNVPNSPDIDFESLMAVGEIETMSGASLLTNGNQEQNKLQNQIPSTSIDAFQNDDSAFSLSEGTVSQNGIFSGQGTTQEGRVTKPNKLMVKDCLLSEKSDSSEQSDSGISSEASVCRTQALNRPISLRIQDARMRPTEGPLQGGGFFCAEIDEELPPSMTTGWATFGNKSEKVRVTRDGLALFGEKIPRGDAPGPVTVTFTTLNDVCVAKTTYTYKKPKNPATWQNSRVKRTLDDIEEHVKRLRSEAYSCFESNEFAGENDHESGGDAPGRATVTFTTRNDVYVAKATYTQENRENPTTWQITHVKRSLDYIEEHVKRLRSVAYLRCESDEFAGENYHEPAVTLVRDQLIEEGYFGDAETSDTEDEEEGSLKSTKPSPLLRVIDRTSTMEDLVWMTQIHFIPSRSSFTWNVIEPPDYECICHKIRLINRFFRRETDTFALNLMHPENEKAYQIECRYFSNDSMLQRINTSLVSVPDGKTLRHNFFSTLRLFCQDSPVVCNSLVKLWEGLATQPLHFENVSQGGIKCTYFGRKAVEQSPRSLGNLPMPDRKNVFRFNELLWHCSRVDSSWSRWNYLATMFDMATLYEGGEQEEYEGSLLRLKKEGIMEEIILELDGSKTRFVKLILNRPAIAYRLASHLSLWSKEETLSQSSLIMSDKFALLPFCEKEKGIVTLLRHSSSIEVVFHPTQWSHEWGESTGVSCAQKVRKQLKVALDPMGVQFSWLEKESDEVGFIRPACCQESSASFCCTHMVQGCNQGECMHLWLEFEHSNDSDYIKNCAAKACNDSIEEWSSWTSIESRILQWRDGRYVGTHSAYEKGSVEVSLLTLILKSLLMRTSNASELALQVQNSLELDQASLKQPGPKTKIVIRFLARNAKLSDKKRIFDENTGENAAGSTAVR